MLGHVYRDIGIDTVASKNQQWMWAGLKLIVQLPREWIGTGEDIKQLVRPIIGEPTHHNAWGALIMNARRQELLIPTGRWLHTKLKPSHARAVLEYSRSEKKQ
jgi:hypothetical protein